MLVAAAAGATMAAWLARQLELPPLGVAAAALAAGVVAGALERHFSGPRSGSEIAWDGQRWQVDGVPGRLELKLDLGRWLMLLRLRPERGGARATVRWLAIEAPGLGFDRPGRAAGADSADLPGRAAAPAAWRALRTAIYSPPTATTPTAPADSAADRAAH
jgi:hypothetical protein